MANSDAGLEIEIREFTDIGESLVDPSEFRTVLSDAKRHIKIRRSLTPQQIDWYGDPVQEEALNWTTKLFLKVAAGQLDSQTVQVGAIDVETLLSKSDDEVTIWVRNMESAIRRINPSTSFGIRSSERRTYGPGDEETSEDNTLL